MGAVVIYPGGFMRSNFHLLYYLISLAVISTNTSVNAQDNSKKIGLKEVAKRAKLPFKIGTAVNFYGQKDKSGPYAPGILSGTNSDAVRDAAHEAILNRDFNLIQTGNELKMFGIWKGVKRDEAGKLTAVCDFNNLKLMADYAIPRKLSLRGHVIVYNAFYQLPQSLFNIEWSKQTAALKPEFTPQDLRDALHSYVSQVVHETLAVNATARRKHRIKKLFVAWDVVNEAVADDDSSNGANGFKYPKNDAWHDAGPKGVGGDSFGYDYVSDVFKWTEEEMLKSIALKAEGVTEADRFSLYYNDFSGEWNPKKWEAMKNLVKHIKETGGRVDGMGFQTHLLANKGDVSAFQLDASIKESIALGLRFSITECDFRIRFDSKEGTLEQQRAWQAKNYADTVKLCKRYSKSCDLLQVWGFLDDGSWIPSVFAGWGEATLYTGWNSLQNNYVAKEGKDENGAAYSSFRDALKSKKSEVN